MEEMMTHATLAGTDTIEERRPSTRLWTKSGPVDSHILIPDEIATIDDQQEASMGEPSSMALFGFAVGTLIIAWPISGFVPIGTLVATVPPVLIFAGIAQFIGGLVALRRGNAFAGTAFCAYGANNAVVAAFLLLGAVGAFPATAGTPAMQMLALELYCFAYISLVLMIIAARLNASFVLVLLALVPGFTMAGMANWYGAAIPAWVGHVGGYCLIASAAFAAYAATAMILNSTWERPMLPLGSLSGDERTHARTTEVVPPAADIYEPTTDARTKDDGSR